MDFLVLCVRGFPGIFHGAVCEMCLMSLMTKMSLRTSAAIFKKKSSGLLYFSRG